MAPQLVPQVVNVSPVVDWLRNLGLAKYEDLFVTEEVDWDTLQWLTEEVSLFSVLNSITHSYDLVPSV